MKSKTRRELGVLNEVLSKTSWTTYRALLGRLCQEYDHFPFVKPISGFVRNGDIQRLVDHVDAMGEQKYLTPTEHFVACQFVALIKKYPFPSDLNPFDPEKTARDKYQTSEAKCLLMNEYFASEFDKTPEVQAVFASMRNFISYCIGHECDLASIWEHCDFGPGASLGVHGNATNLARKIASDWSVSPAAYLYARSAIYNNWHCIEALSDAKAGEYICIDPEVLNQHFLSRTSICTYNKIAFVPKTVKTLRSIAVEPLLNGFVQKGIDAVMRRRLLRVGIDLSDQSINSKMAFVGSLSDEEDSFVTIDLASASDSISIGLCKTLLPPAWYEFLNDIRSKNYLLDDTVRVYNKFCSMGNGFCFPLETLLFTAACVAVGCGNPGVDFHVYGDDIIVRKRYASSLLSLLGTMGFEVNKGKTFLEGPFRESCGTDWFQGEDVRPFILDEDLGSLPNLFKFLNLTKRSARCSEFFKESREFIISLIPDSFRFVRPYSGPADSAASVSLDECTTSHHVRWNTTLSCWQWKELITRPVLDDWLGLRNAHCAHMMAALRGSSSSEPFTLRRKTRTTIRNVSHGGATSTWLPGRSENTVSSDSSTS